jgi:hypothetical protein
MSTQNALRFGRRCSSSRRVASRHGPRGSLSFRLPRFEFLEVRSLLSIGLANLAVTSPINENDLAHLTGVISDSNPSNALTLAVDWGDGSALDKRSLPARRVASRYAGRAKSRQGAGPLRMAP